MIAGVIGLAVRGCYMHRLLRSFDVLAPRAARGAADAARRPALVLLLRLVASWDRTPGVAIGELAVYVVMTGAATWLLERGLLLEAVGYLRRRRPAPAPGA